MNVTRRVDNVWISSGSLIETEGSDFNGLEIKDDEEAAEQYLLEVDERLQKRSDATSKIEAVTVLASEAAQPQKIVKLGDDLVVCETDFVFDNEDSVEIEKDVTKCNLPILTTLERVSFVDSDDDLTFSGTSGSSVSDQTVAKENVNPDDKFHDGIEVVSTHDRNAILNAFCFYRPAISLCK